MACGERLLEKLMTDTAGPRDDREIHNRPFSRGIRRRVRLRSAIRYSEP
jgi:hypothetical protein